MILIDPLESSVPLRTRSYAFAYKYGAAPHGGMGIGLDRLAMIMCGADSLRDVTAFPKVQNASELMSACPAEVDSESLDILGIKVTKKEEE